MPYYPSREPIEDDELLDSAPYTSISNKEPSELPNEAMSVKDTIAQKFGLPQKAEYQERANTMANLGQAFGSFSRGVNAPVSNDDLYANMAKQSAGMLKMVGEDEARAQKVKEAIANRGLKEKLISQQATDKQTEFGLKKRALDIAESDKSAKNELAQLKLDAAAKTKEEPKSVSKLNSTDKGRYDNVKMASDAINGMVEALNQGQSRYSLLGDNDFTQNLTIFSEALGRMQSGGAINKEESARFMTMARSAFDDPTQTQKKLARLKMIMDDRMKTLDQEPVPSVAFKQKLEGMGNKAVAGQKPKVLTQNGHTYILNEETGEYE